MIDYKKKFMITQWLMKKKELIDEEKQAKHQLNFEEKEVYHQLTDEWKEVDHELTDKVTKKKLIISWPMVKEKTMNNDHHLTEEEVYHWLTKG